MRDWPKKVQPKYPKAIFLDRDGTINVDTHYPHNADDLILIPRVVDAIQLLARLEFHLIVISNQGGIPLGFFTPQQMSKFNKKIRLLIEAGGGRLDAFYYSPYLELKNMSPGGGTLHPTTKPNPGMLLEAAQDFSIDLSQSFVIGDKTSDIVAGQQTNCSTILVLTGKAGKEEDAIPASPDYTVADLYEAAMLIYRLTAEKSNPKG